MLKEGHILWALRSHFSNGSEEAACALLMAMSDASEGILTPFNPDVRLRGAVNRNMVTCYLDATLFSMFSRLDSFEAMLYNSFEDVQRERLAFLLRLWVNLMRSGQLIPTDITHQIQESLAECGWKEARELHQQDASEAFSFLTEKLNLPLLTLKMDIYHTGKQDSDDHKFINERLLEVAIPTLENGRHPESVKLEDCLEEYFNNRIEVKRYLERRNTLQSVKSSDKAKEAGMSIHVETVELDPEVSTPLTPLSPLPGYMAERPLNRHRAASIIQERYIPDKSDISGTPPNDSKTPLGRLRTGSVRKEVLMPAWQFFSLIPWYTDNAPSSDAQVAAHFSSKRPVLGLCLKRYSYTPQGHAIRLNTFVDIPVEIGLPHFIQDDHMQESGPIYGNFKLSLQAMVCHRGHSVDSGHYISLVKSNTVQRGSEQELSHWLRFDDLAQQRVSLVDIQRALREETPYLLFYQILPVEGDPGNLTSGEQLPQSTASIPLRSPPLPAQDPSTTGSTETESHGRPSTDIASSDDGRGRGAATDKRRPSVISFHEYHPVDARTSSAIPHETAEQLAHKKSGSFNNGLTKTWSILGNKQKQSSKDDLEPKRITNSEATPQIHIDEVASQEDVARSNVDTIRSKSESGLSSAVGQQQASSAVNRSRSKREKSRSRLLKSGKTKEEDDRECLVM